LLAAAISAGIGVGMGIVAGLILLLVSGQKVSDHFVDRTYWINDDGISNVRMKSERLERSMKPILPIKINVDEHKQEIADKNEEALREKNVRIEYSEVVPFDLSTPNFEMSFSEGSKNEKSHAYL
jgi:hypothetical protein